MMLDYLKISLIFSLGLLVACGESDTPQEKVTTAPVEVVTETVEETASEAITTTEAEVIESVSTAEQASDQLDDDVVVQETISEAVNEVKEQAEEVVTAVAGDKPYQVIDGAISANAIEGWKTYNGGGCGACHGKGGIGAVGPNLAQSVTQKLSKEEFVDIVTNGKPGTMMRPHKTNTRVMDNLDNLYAYLVARGDDVLGPGNLIKLPLGK